MPDEVCAACTLREHWSCALGGCACDCNPDAVLEARHTARDPLVAREFGLWDVYDPAPCPFCGEPACERSCTGALLPDAPGEDADCPPLDLRLADDAGEDTP